MLIFLEALDLFAIDPGKFIHHFDEVGGNSER
jgi:hypothetical protein